MKNFFSWFLGLFKPKPSQPSRQPIIYTCSKCGSTDNKWIREEVDPEGYSDTGGYIDHLICDDCGCVIHSMKHLINYHA